MTSAVGRPILPLLLVTALLIIAFPVSAVTNLNFTPAFDSDDQVHYNVSSHIDTSGATPFEVWGVAALAGLVLFFISLKVSTSTAEIERDALISVISWIPLAFTAYTSFAVDRITFYGAAGLVESQAANGAIQFHEYTLLENHVIYHFDVIGILFAILFVIAIINTIRILAIHKSLRLQQET
jgi:hypothetical protein